MAAAAASSSWKHQICQFFSTTFKVSYHKDTHTHTETERKYSVKGSIKKEEKTRMFVELRERESRKLQRPNLKYDKYKYVFTQVASKLHS